MTDIKTKVQGMDANLRARDVAQLASHATNVYEAIAIMEKRARQLAVEIKEELHGKLAEFAIQTDTIEEIHENKEQIEISKFYERMPNPALISTDEFLTGKLDIRYKGDEEVDVNSQENKEQ